MTKRRVREIRETIKSIALLLIIIACFCVGSYVETHYTREATVVKVANNIVTVVDKCGYRWQFKGDGFKLDDEVKMTMDTMRTDFDISDDEIQKVKIINK